MLSTAALPVEPPAPTPRDNRDGLAVGGAALGGARPVEEEVDASVEGVDAVEGAAAVAPNHALLVHTEPAHVRARGPRRGAAVSPRNNLFLGSGPPL